MSENDTLKLTAMIEALDAKVEARLRDTTPMWEVVVSRLDTIIAEQANQGRRLDEIERRLDGIEGRLKAVETRVERIEIKVDSLEQVGTEVRQLRRRIEGMTDVLSRDVVEVRAAQRDLEVRVEKLEKPTA